MLCHPILSRDSVDQAHILLVEFCKQFESLYGPEHCTPNMHMPLHLKECLLDFGPLPAFWCFAFECFNGVLEGISKSWVLPEKQIFIKFVDVLRLLSNSKNKGETNNVLSFICDNIKTKGNIDSGSLGLHRFDDSAQLQFFCNTSCCVDQIMAEKRIHQKLILPYKEKYFDNMELLHLKHVTSIKVSRGIKVLQGIQRYCHQQCRIYIKTITLAEVFVIAARWPGVIGIDRLGESPLRVGLVKSFIENEVTVLWQILMDHQTQV